MWAKDSTAAILFFSQTSLRYSKLIAKTDWSGLIISLSIHCHVLFVSFKTHSFPHDVCTKSCCKGHSPNLLLLTMVLLHWFSIISYGDICSLFSCLGSRLPLKWSLTEDCNWLGSSLDHVIGKFSRKHIYALMLHRKWCETFL